MTDDMIKPEPPPPTPPVTLKPTPKISTPADHFRRGIKRDPSLFPVLKDEAQNDHWHRSFVNQVRAQGLSDILNPHYVPNSTEDRDLFDEMQKYMYAVLEDKVQTDQGKLIIRQHEDIYDAQSAYRDLLAHHKRSTKALMNSADILSYITSARLGSGEWKGSTENFIIHWKNQIWLYEHLVPDVDHFSNGQKRIMLENAVTNIDELRHVKISADLERTKSGRL